ncbi:protein rad9 [Pluteus cervinus]|uniref:Protein rad9 n=1 Tax=Pluteus cervinus TaxID=181527 RepID=A0ACD3AUS6_9AGAR|nr:protein rad9 [Pluteus cervinus]
MDRNHWQPQQQHNFYQNGSQHYYDPRARHPRIAPDSVQDAHGLLAVYPMASATPTTHVARHLNNMAMTAPPPSFSHPSYYSAQHSNYSGQPPQYTEYPRELSYLNTSTNDSGYWESARNEVVGLIGHQGNNSVYAFDSYSNWPQAPVPTSFQPTPFAQSVMSRIIPATSYPTPPPPGISSSSSSLAMALGPLPTPTRTPASVQQPLYHQHRLPPPPPPQSLKTMKPADATMFFNEFLEHKTREMSITECVQPRVITPPPRIVEPHESPDPLTLAPIHPRPVASVVTPRKRKPITQMESPSIKRIQSLKTEYAVPQRNQSGSPMETQVFNESSPQRASSPTKRATSKVFVEIPKKSWLTQSSPQVSPQRPGKRQIDDDTSDLGGYGSEGTNDSPVKRREFSDPLRSGRRSDERAPLDKFLELMGDIFEAEDTLPPELSPDDLSDFFSGLSANRSHPLLHSNVVKKLTKLVGQVARPTKRMRQGTSGTSSTPRAMGRMAEVDSQMLSRILKMLDRNVKAGEDLDPFANSAMPSGPSVKSSPRKKKPAKKKADRRSKTPRGEGEEDDHESVQAEPEDVESATREVTESDIDDLGHLLETARNGILAADGCIALLGSDRLTKQLYSEELITSCLGCIKSQLTKLIYPFVEGSTDLGSIGANNHPLLQCLVKDSSPKVDGLRRQLNEVFQALSGVLPKINKLVNAESVAMSDSIIIQAVFIAIGPFFVVEPGEGDTKGKKENVVSRTLGKSAMRGLRLDALSLIRSIFANHEAQRSWIIEEILSSLIKLSDTKQKAGQFKLRDGRSIRTVSALLLQLVQTSAHDIRIDARNIHKARQNKLALRRQESMYDSQNAGQQIADPFLDDTDHDEIRLYLTGLESATKAAKTIILFLTQRSGKGKATKNSNEAEYRTIFDNFISDLLTVHNWPEWPAAGLLLNIASKFMVASLDDVKSASQSDNNAAKTMALDHLGVIAAHLRNTNLKVLDPRNQGGYRGLKPLEEIVSSEDAAALEKFLAAHRDVAMHLAKMSSEDQAYDSARELTAVTLAQEIAQALKQIDTKLDHPEEDEDMDLLGPHNPDKLHTFGSKVKMAMRSIWKEPSGDVFDIGSQDDATRIDRLAEEIGTIQYMRGSFQPILSVILSALDAPPIFMRTKALRALGQIVTSDATILSTASVRRAIESHLLDSSPAVRDAAVELIGKYMVDAPEVASDYYQKIADRIADTGLAVRKRVIKLLKSFYAVTDSNPRRIDIATRMVLRMLDEDDTVKELALKSVEELWFSSASVTSTASRGRAIPVPSQQDKSALLSKVEVIMGTAANFKDRQSPLEDLLHKIMTDKQGTDREDLHARYSEICEALIDGLVDDSDLPGLAIINSIRTIYLFTSAYPAVLSGSHVKALLTYLKNPTTAEEQARSDYLLKIFRAAIPHLPKTAAKFGQDLQQTLQPMVVKPFGSSVQVLQEIVACLCTVVRNLTHDFIPLINLVKSINVKVQAAIRRPSTEMTSQEVISLTMIIYIVSLLGEYCDFDQLRVTNADLAPEINGISTKSIVEHIYDSLLRLYEKFTNVTLRNRILQCLGFLFRAQPTLMTKDRSAIIMDAIFNSPEQEGRARLLKIMQDFLLSEAAKHATAVKENSKSQNKPIEVNMDELVGNTDGFADSGVSSAIVQRYLGPILEAALSQNLQIQAAAVDVLSFTIKQGLAHPLQSFPVIVALETSPSSNLSNRASALHTLLHGKHASLLNTRYIISARASFDYQKKITTGLVQGFRLQGTPVALLQRWYSHVREKRPTRQEFLKAMVKVFQDNPSNQSSQDDVDFVRYMAENFSAFEYKTQEEVITVIKHLTTVLSTTGMQLLETVSPSHLLSHLHNTAESQPPTDAEVIDGPSEKDAKAEVEGVPLMRTTIVVSMVMLLKAYLKTLYSLSEEKCNKFVLGKKSAVGDRPASKRHDNAISWNRLLFATSPLITSEDVNVQKRTFLAIWNEDGVSAEPEDDFT